MKKLDESGKVKFQILFLAVMVLLPISLKLIAQTNTTSSASTAYVKNPTGPCTPGIPCAGTITPLVVSPIGGSSSGQTVIQGTSPWVVANASATPQINTNTFIQNPLPTPAGGYSSQGSQTTAATLQSLQATKEAISANSLTNLTPVFGVNVFNAVATATPTATPVLVDVTVRTFTSAQSTTPTPIVTAVASNYNHVQLFMNNTGTAGDFVTVYMGSVAKQVYLAPAGGVVIKSFWAATINAPVSVAGGTTAGATIVVWGLLDQQTYQVPVNLPSN